MNFKSKRNSCARWGLAGIRVGGDEPEVRLAPLDHAHDRRRARIGKKPELCLAVLGHEFLDRRRQQVGQNLRDGRHTQLPCRLTAAGLKELDQGIEPADVRLDYLQEKFTVHGQFERSSLAHQEHGAED